MRVFVLVWLGIGLAAWGGNGWRIAADRAAAQALLAETRPYRCLAANGGAKVAWQRRGLLWQEGWGPRGVRRDMLATLRQPAGETCILGGDATTFLFQPDGEGALRLAARLPGGVPQVVPRAPGAYADLRAGNGSLWRNEGDGYRRIDGVESAGR